MDKVGESEHNFTEIIEFQRAKRKNAMNGRIPTLSHTIVRSQSTRNKK
jgi:hypothetical protein